MGRKIFSFTVVATVLLTLAILVLGGLNVDQKRKYVPPDDGCSWIQGSQGVQAMLLVAGGPAEVATIQRGDILKAINGVPIRTDRDVTKRLYAVGVWGKATYTLERNGSVFDLTLV